MRSILAFLLAASVCAPLFAQVTQRVSVSSAGVPGDSLSYTGSVSTDGRFVVFTSFADNLVPGDMNGFADVFLRDRLSGTTERVSVDSNGSEGNWASEGGWATPDGRYVTFSSFSTNLVPGDTNGWNDVFLRDRLLRTTERVSVSSGGAQGDSGSSGGPITSDGRYVVFVSNSTNLVPGVPSGLELVYLRDLHTGTTEIVSLTHNGAVPNGWCYGCSISDDGRYVAFLGEASNLVPNDTNYDTDVFVRDRLAGTTERVNVSSSGRQAFGTGGQDVFSTISGNGRFVAFEYFAGNLVPGDTNGCLDVFVRDLRLSTTERISVSSAGVQGDGPSYSPGISSDGRFVAFSSSATNLVPGDTNGVPDVFVRDRNSNTTVRVSVGADGVQSNGASGDSGMSPSVDGRFVLFESDASNLVPGPATGHWDIYVHDRLGGPDFTSLCDAGTSGVIGCPCGNPASGPDRGCDNSAGTGGAILSALGGTFLSSDSLEFTTRGDLPISLSILTQWTGVNPMGAIFGMGVRCTSGAFKRLYTKAAVNGSITAPDFSVNEAQVSARSASLGDVIHAGESRWYVVMYRDPIVLGGCPASSTFNCTQTGRVDWAP